jgi:hypothetical protein
MRGGLVGTPHFALILLVRKLDFVSEITNEERPSLIFGKPSLLHL